MEKLESKKPENNTSAKEKEPKPIVALLYRGENKFMRPLAPFLTATGFQVHIEELPVQYENEEEIANIVLQSLSRIDKITKECPIIIDSTISDKLKTKDRMFIEERLVEAYEVLRGFNPELYLSTVGLYVDEIRKLNKIPVILTFGLGHHIFFSLDSILKNQEKNKIEILEQSLTKDSAGWDYSSRGDNAVEESAHISAILATKFDLPIISQQKFDPRNNNIQSIPGILKDMDITPEQTILLVDHHIYEIREDEDIHKSEIKSIELIPICACDMRYNSSLEPEKFKISKILENKSVQKKLEKIDQEVYQKTYASITEKVKQKMDTLKKP